MKASLALAVSLAVIGPARGGALVVKASPATSPCAAAAAEAFRQATGGPVEVQTAAIGRVGSASGADVVVAIEEELTRVIEGGESVPDLEFEVATIPWVLTGAGAGAPDLRGLARSGERVRVLGGAIGRHARQSLETLPPDRVETARTADGLRNLAPGELALVPLSLAAPGPVTATDVPALVAKAVGVRGSPRAGAARAFLDFIAAGPGNAAFRSCGRGTMTLRPAWKLLPLVAAVACGSDPPNPSPSPSASATPCPAATSAYGVSVAEWWIPASSLAQNIYNNPQEAVGAPNAGGFGPSNYTGFVSLGFGGHVTVDLGGCVTDVAGNDLRIYQSVSSEPLSVYVSTSPDGPFTLLLPFFQDCGAKVQGDAVKKQCEFDLASAGVSRARYVRVEDAEIYPCPCGTGSEGADLDAVQALALSTAVGRAEGGDDR